MEFSNMVFRPKRQTRFEWTEPDIYPDTESDAYDEVLGEEYYTFDQYGLEVGEVEQGWGEMLKNSWQPFNYRTNHFAETLRVSKWDNSVYGTKSHRSWAGARYKPFTSTNPDYDYNNITSAFIDISFGELKNDLITSQGVDNKDPLELYMLMAPGDVQLFNRKWGWMIRDSFLAEPAVDTTNVMVNELSTKKGQRVRVYETNTTSPNNRTGELGYVNKTVLNETFDPRGLTLSFLEGGTYMLSPIVVEDSFQSAVTSVTTDTITDSTKTWVENELVGRHLWRFSNPGIYWTIVSNTENTFTVTGVDLTTYFAPTTQYVVGPLYSGSTIYGDVSALTPTTLQDTTKSWTSDEHIGRRLFEGQSFNPALPYDGLTYWVVDGNTSNIITVTASGSTYVRQAVYLEDRLSQVYDKDSLNGRIWYCESENLYKTAGLIPLADMSTDSAYRVYLPLDEFKQAAGLGIGLNFVFVPKSFEKSNDLAAHWAVFPGLLTAWFSTPCMCDGICDLDCAYDGFCDGDCSCDGMCDMDCEGCGCEYGDGGCCDPVDGF